MRCAKSTSCTSRKASHRHSRLTAQPNQKCHVLKKRITFLPFLRWYRDGDDCESMLSARPEPYFRLCSFSCSNPVDQDPLIKDNIVDRRPHCTDVATQRLKTSSVMPQQDPNTLAF